MLKFPKQSLRDQSIANFIRKNLNSFASEDLGDKGTLTRTRNTKAGLRSIVNNFGPLPKYICTSLEKGYILESFGRDLGNPLNKQFLRGTANRLLVLEVLVGSASGHIPG